MRCICCECRTLYDIKPPYDDDNETHGLCDECFEITMVKVEAHRKAKRAEKDGYHRDHTEVMDAADRYIVEAKLRLDSQVKVYRCEDMSQEELLKLIPKR